MKLKPCTRKTEELTPGLAVGRVCFKFTLYENRGSMDQARFDSLRQDLLANGIRNPLIIHDNHILIGMRRFDIMREQLDEFDCLELVDEDLSKWSSASVLNLIKIVNHEYRERDRAA